MSFVSLDIEIAQEIPKGEKDWQAHRPLGISCAAICWDHNPSVSIFPACERMVGKSEGSSWEGEKFLPRMTQENAQNLVNYLDIAHGDITTTLLTFNGVSLDWQVLAEESGEYIRCVELALDHVDIFFQIFCLLGYAPGLDAVAKGMGFPGKMEDMDGTKAPVLWKRGEYAKVMEYVAQDARITVEVAKAIEREGVAHWRSRSGNLNTVSIDRWLTVRECLALPEPDTSWMKNEPWARSRFTEWLAGYA